MFIFLYKGGFETGESMGVFMSENLRNFRATKNLARVVRRRGKIKPTDVLMRWGTTKDPELDRSFISAGAVVLNKASGIENNTNKLNSLVLFKKNGVNVPRFYKNKNDIERFPVLGRKFNHKGGKDIIIINGSLNRAANDYSKIPDRHFYTEFIPSKAEYRVHIFCGKVIRVTKKVFRGHDRFDQQISDKCIIRNDTFGWGHHAVTEQEMQEISSEAINNCIIAVKAVGLDFGAVDLLIGNDNKPYVLEVNSCPRLNSIGIDVYLKAIKDVLARTNNRIYL